MIPEFHIVLIQESLGYRYSRFIAICTDVHGRCGDTVFFEQKILYSGISKLSTTCAASQVDC